MSSEVSKRYSEALFALAYEQGTIKELQEEVKQAQVIFEENEILMDFFRAVKISKPEKKELIHSVFASFSKDFQHFLMLLVDKDRMYYIDEMLLDLDDLCNDALGIVKATVYSARPLQKEDLTRIQKALEVKTKKTIELCNRVDESLIAGIKVVVGSNVTDVSMAHSLDSLKQMLLSKGEVL